MGSVDKWGCLGDLWEAGTKMIVFDKIKNSLIFKVIIL